MTIALCVLGIVLYSAIFGVHVGKQILTMFLTITLLLTFCYLVGYLNTPVQFNTYAF